MPDLVWTKEPPSVAGWYWIRFDGKREQIAYYSGISLPTTDKDDDREWSGPIPQPKERDDDAE